MSRLVSIFFIVLVTALITGGGVFYFENRTNESESTPSTTVEEDSTVLDTVNHYSDDYIDFDYPGDIELFVSRFGEGSLGEYITFLSPYDSDGTLVEVGPKITLSNLGDWSDSGVAGDSYEKERSDDSIELELVGLEAFLKPITNDFSGEKYSEVHFLTERKLSDGTPEDFYGYFSSASPVGIGSRYKEILELFQKTLSH